MSGEPALLALARRLADGEAVDWARQRSTVGADEADVVDRLALLDRLRRTLRDGPAPGLTEAPLHWGHLALRGELARGGSSVVYLAFDAGLARDVALKLRVGWKGDGEGAALWIAEARRLARVRHPAVLAIHGADVHDGVPGLWCERLTGRTLAQADAAEAAEAASIERVLDVAEALTGAVEAVHEAGLVHGDVTPANVMLEDDGRVVLMDFGASGELDPTGTTEDRAGTPLAMAPERLGGARLGPAADLFGIGVVLYVLLEGRYPVTGDSAEALRDRWLRGDRPEFARPSPRALRRLIGQLLATEPGRRPGIAEARDALRRIREAPRRRRRRAAAFAVFAALSIGLTASLTAWRVTEQSRRESEAVNRFLTDVLAAPRRTRLGPATPIAELIDEAAIRAESDLAAQPRALADVLSALGSSYEQLKRPDAARPLLERALALHRRLGQPVEAGAARVVLAKAARASGDPDRARRLDRETLDALAGQRGPAMRVRSLAQLGLALTRIAEGDLARARAEMDDALALVEAGGLAGASDEWALVLLESAQLDQRLGRDREAVEPLTAALAFFVDRYGERNHNAFAARNALVAAMDRTGQLDEAASLAAANLEVARDWLGPGDRLTIAASDTLANLLSRKGRPDEALAINRHAIGSLKDDAEAWQRLQLVANQVGYLLDTGQPALALTAAEGVLPAIRDELGDNHPLAVITGLNRADALLALERPAEAVDVARGYLETLRASHGDGHPFTLVGGYLVGAGLSELGDTEAAEPLLVDSHAGLSAALGADHPVALKSAAFLGGHWRRAGEVEAARAVIEPALREAQRTLGDGHLRTRQLRVLAERLAD